jgi:hypothetical protein
MASSMKNFKTHKTGDTVFKTWSDFLTYINQQKIGGGFEFYNLKGKHINTAILTRPKVEDRTGWGH